MTDRLVQLVDQWDETTRFDEAKCKDLRELSQEALGERFDLDYNESGMFWYIIKEDQEPEYCTYGVEEKNASEWLEQVQEAVHQSYEGPWTDYDRIVIRAFLADITWATYQVIKDKASGRI